MALRSLFGDKLRLAQVFGKPILLQRSGFSRRRDMRATLALVLPRGWTAIHARIDTQAMHLLRRQHGSAHFARNTGSFAMQRVDWPLPEG